MFACGRGWVGAFDDHVSGIDCSARVWSVFLLSYRRDLPLLGFRFGYPDLYRRGCSVRGAA